MRFLSARFRINGVPVLSIHTHILEQSRHTCFCSTRAISSVNSPQRSHTCHLLITSFCGMFHGGDDLSDDIVVLEFLSFSHPLDVGRSTCLGADDLATDRVGCRPFLYLFVTAHPTDVVAWTKAQVHVFPLFTSSTQLLDEDFTRIGQFHCVYMFSLSF